MLTAGNHFSLPEHLPRYSQPDNYIQINQPIKVYLIAPGSLQSLLISDEGWKLMMWLTAIGCLAIGILIGLVVASRLNFNQTRIQELENQIRQLKYTHNNYRDNVSDHFSMTAELFQHMTESYKEVYQHLASGAQELCNSDVAGKLLPARTDSEFQQDEIDTRFTSVINPPKDYAAKLKPGQKGALSEDFGIDKTKPVLYEESSTPQSF